MYKIAIPIGLKSIEKYGFEHGLRKYAELCRKGAISRVFIADVASVYSEECMIDAHSEQVSTALSFFKSEGIEAGVWLGGFGHGSMLSHDSGVKIKGTYQKQTGVMGESYEHGYCPLDESFERDYLDVIYRAAQLKPDIIMIDDDFRLNLRPYYMGCFCPLHLKRFYSAIGEEIPREKIETLIFTGGRNKYRDAYLNMSRETLLGFAKKIRQTIDSVDKTIRAGVCTSPDAWDYEGTDAIELAYAFAGDTKPFSRTFGAPYHNKYVLIPAIENERMQAQWFKTYAPDIETFAEGDVYPRPRYHVPARALELFDLALMCDGKSDGVLKYMFDYTQRLGYDNGYIDRHTADLKIYKQVKALFEGKKSTGVFVFNAMHKIKDWTLPMQCEENIGKKLVTMYKSFTAEMLSKNTIPTCYEKSEYPVMCCGESAAHIDRKMLENGAVLDVASAEKLTLRGIDVGLEKVEECSAPTGEYYIRNDDIITGLSGCRIKKVTCRENAVVLSVFLPEETPAAYMYENKSGERFLVFASDFQFSSDNTDYYNSYYRQEMLCDAIEWVGRKKLPAVCEGNPNLYMLASCDDTALSVLLLNIFMDEVINPAIELGDEYEDIKFVNCSGSLDGNRISLSSIGPYAFAAFEVRKGESGRKEK